MPKTKNVSRAQWDHATRSTVAGTSNHNNTDNNDSNNGHTLSALATALSPPTRVRPHASRTTSTMSATATRTRRAKENAENTTTGGGEKENTGRLRQLTRTHITPGTGVLATTHLSTTRASNAVLGNGSSKPTPKPSKPTKTKVKVKKQPLQDVTAQFVCGGPGAGESANRAGTAFALLAQEEVGAMRAQPGNGVEVRAPTPERVATPRLQRTQKRRGAREPTSPLPPSSPPSDYRLPSSLNLHFALPPPSVAPLRALDASPTHSESRPVTEYDRWASFDSAPLVGSPFHPVAVPVTYEEQAEEDKEDPFGFVALERKLKAHRALRLDDYDIEDKNEHDGEHDGDEEEDVHNIPVADTSSPRPDGVLRLHSRNTLKRALEDEMDEEENQDLAARVGDSSPVPVAAVLSSPVRAAIAAAGPASTPAAAGGVDGSPEHPHVHAHFATPPTPQHKTKRRRISGVPHAEAEVANDVFGPVETCSSSSPGRVAAESPSPSKSTRKITSAVRPPRVSGAEDALDVFNAVLDAQEGAPSVAAAVPEHEDGNHVHEVGGRTLRSRASRTALAPDHIEVEAQKEPKMKTRSASRGRGRGRGASRARGASRGASKSRGRRVQATSTSRNKAKDDQEDADEEEELVDLDEKFEQERQARIAYFRGLDDYEVETEDVVFI